MTQAHAALLRTLCFFDVLGYPLTFAEWLAWSDQKQAEGLSREALSTAAQALIDEGRVVSSRGRMIFPHRQELIVSHEERAWYQPRKLRVAKRVAEWLVRIQGVRFVALCNTTALGHARDAADLDFFVITRDQTIWQVRGWATLPFKVIGKRPQADVEVPDAVCLSFFLDETALNFAPLALSEDDPYLRYWFLSLLPLYDDGVGEALWDANASFRSRHALASPWIVNPALARSRPCIRIPTPSFLESFAARSQARVLPTQLQQSNDVDRSVVCTPHILKFHTQDARARIRADYYARCQTYDVDP